MRWLTRGVGEGVGWKDIWFEWGGLDDERRG